MLDYRTKSNVSNRTCIHILDALSCQTRKKPAPWRCWVCVTRQQQHGQKPGRPQTSSTLHPSTVSFLPYSLLLLQLLGVGGSSSPRSMNTPPTTASRSSSTNVRVRGDAEYLTLRSELTLRGLTFPLGGGDSAAYPKHNEYSAPLGFSVHGHNW